MLFIKKNSIQKINQNSSISIFSSSPRRQYNLESFVKNYLPFQIKILHLKILEEIYSPVLKNLDGNVDGFVVAKAAIDRLLNADQTDFPDLRNNLFSHISECL